MKAYLQRQLASLAGKILAKYQPEIIGITGNVGKTTTREVLEGYLRNRDVDVRASLKNYNNEWGVPLTIIGTKAPGKNPFKWLGVFFKGWRLLAKEQDYPRVLVLELGIDGPGDMDRFVDLLYLDTLILTYIGEHPVHKAFFTDAKALAKEKLKALQAVTSDGTIIYNADEPFFTEVTRRKNAVGTILSFGLNDADFQAHSLEQSLAGEEERLEAYGSALVPYLSGNVTHRGSSVPLRVPYLFAESQIYSVLPTIAYGVSRGTNMLEVLEDISYYPVPGRLRFLEGQENALLIDDTYNASPASMHQALGVFQKLDTDEARSIAVLGDMKELGDDAEDIHRALEGMLKEDVDLFVGVGEYMHTLVEDLQEEPLLETAWFANSEEAAEWLQPQIAENDIILVKGSQSMRMERVVKTLMKFEKRAEELLVRQK